MIKTILKILKKMLIGILGIILLIVIAGTIFINTSPQFGGKPSEESLVRIENSANYNGDGTFKNLELTLASTGMKLSTIPKFFTNGNNKVPENKLPQKQLSKSYFDNEPDQPRITWFGHSTLFVEMEGKNIFIDPMLGEVPAPHPLLGNPRFNKELPISIENLPEIDLVLISHDHYDHLDYGSIQQLKNKVKQFYVPLGIKAHLTEWGVLEEKIKEFDWWETSTFEGINLVATPARHFSGRGLKRNNTLWCSWVIKSENNSIFFSGDSGYGKHFKEIGEKYGPFDFAMMECGQYNEQWAHIHMTPEETIQASVDVQAKTMMPIHWGAFKLALHTWNDPVERASKKAKELNVHISTPKIGEAIVLNEEKIPSENWWTNN
ncbi:MBL fold metallo-hydrolase [Lutibacter sp. TH_r2]|uniref:MBL fold metallo-hydrolase n=1 Tax=Lutibacter sp. TH_r2 TaxID=3082083 RepID=UPI002954B8E7|nr:MBL fold metallo-hydrolase [Lutibacter sp. TH_r2]MDV7186601.1 MBL fold metallo-hydrolase [Lutibacter sp. TH_r2]